MGSATSPRSSMRTSSACSRTPIAHAGYALLGVLGFGFSTGTEWFGLWGGPGLLLAYTVHELRGVLPSSILLEREGLRGGVGVSDFNGLARRNDGAGRVMLLFLLSLTGIPPTAGFIGKYYLFTAAMKAGYAWLAVLRGC